MQADEGTTLGFQAEMPDLQMKTYPDGSFTARVVWRSDRVSAIVTWIDAATQRSDSKKMSFGRNGVHEMVACQVGPVAVNGALTRTSDLLTLTLIRLDGRFP